MLWGSIWLFFGALWVVVLCSVVCWATLGHGAELRRLVYFVYKGWLYCGVWKV